ncbi:MAG: hypothetical protein J0I68_20230 [Achromobacter sp.]|jgi:hypothetical protein|uniref:Uncharacterized protein n=1 Tax=Achromobacter insuavis TaxID=1287735 RepID=A0A6J5B9M8_9BURK|nr:MULTISPECIES: hypothetical protein [Achromobacter]MBN9640876.1 hypothetical protein [Achromobacter sp.]CAB3697408.1 hypothetical protein LMG26845_05056 [Achromobacter insuavis]CUJ43940.1 Uncharacterised protein [Achromobacter sp. 2789STDY5608633]CUJ77038.1 Uncharacterised protein [Achromobacter sp. 2789STDY5608628]
MADAAALDAIAPPLRAAIGDCVAAINLARQHFESRHDATLPDPLQSDPAALRRLSEAIAPVIERLAAEPDNGHGWGAGGGSPLGYREARPVTLGLWRGSHGRPGDADGTLDYTRCLYLLFQAARLPPAAMAQAIAPLRDDIVFNHVALHIIEDALAQALRDGASQAARAAAAEPYIQLLRVTHIFREEDNRYQGYRILLRDAADQGDAAAALKLLPQCNTRSERHEIDTIKSRLVAAVSARDGLQAALDLCDNKRIGAACREYALQPVIDAGAYDALRAALAQHPDLATADSGDGLGLLVPAFCVREKTAGATRDVQEFDALFARVDAMDPKLKHGDARLRDWLLLELGLASRGDPAYLGRCRKAIKNASIKRELDGA